MQDHLIDPDCDDLMTGATAHHWAEILKHGTTTFHSDDEIRVVSKDAIMREVLDELDDKGLDHSVMAKDFILTMCMIDKCEQRLKLEMEEALHDYYS